MSDWQLRPAGDMEMSYRDRVRSARREASVFSSATRFVWWLVVRIVMKIWHRYSVTGREHLPRATPLVLVANHSSHLDVACLMLALPWRLRNRVHPLAAADHFFGEMPKATFTAFAINALPIDRKSGKGRETMQSLRERLLADRFGVVLFPEGTRSASGALGEFKSGVGILVAETNVPVVPAFIEGAFDAFPKAAKWPFPRKVRLRLGKPLVFADLPQDPAGYQEVARRLRDAVIALSDSRQ